MASVTHMGVAATDHVVLYGLRNIAGGCTQAGYEFFRANIGGLGTAPNPGVDPPLRLRRGQFIVAAGARLCPIVFPGPTVDPGGTSAGLQEMIVRGYVVTARR